MMSVAIYIATRHTFQPKPQRFSLKKAFFIFSKKIRPKKFLIFSQKKSFSHISGNGTF